MQAGYQYGYAESVSSYLKGGNMQVDIHPAINLQAQKVSNKNMGLKK